MPQLLQRLRRGVVAFCRGDGLLLPAGQSIYDPSVFGRYDLATQRVVPIDGAEDLFNLDLDLAMSEAQRHSAQFSPAVERDRYAQVLALLGPGEGVCLDACTPLIDPEVVRRVEALGYRYVAIDVQGDGRRILREDLTRLTFDDASISCVISLDTLEHIEGWRAALRELLRVLRPGGMLFLHVPCYYIGRGSSVPTTPGVDPWGHIAYMSARELIEGLLSEGFVLLRASLQLDYGALLAVAARPH